MTRTLVQVVRLSAIPERGIFIKDYTPPGYVFVNIQHQNDCLYLTFHEIDEVEENMPHSSEG